ncbi:uncharacterized protein LOC34617508 [Cyclospora cayetanensis]|uniref:Uncharacterized protein LOC34617508 n=1 Tax=Cyclospora cayetanensis TaxID=88456 RepID=A0A6P6RUN7_9EIME|nr:uncharacterized protein LOC34617508 [Cyclospora cayetanensis]
MWNDTSQSARVATILEHRKPSPYGASSTFKTEHKSDIIEYPGPQGKWFQNLFWPAPSWHGLAKYTHRPGAAFGVSGDLVLSVAAVHRVSLHLIFGHVSAYILIPCASAPTRCTTIRIQKWKPDVCVCGLHSALAIGALVVDYPIHACQQLVGDMETAGRLGASMPLSTVLPALSGASEHPSHQAATLLDLDKHYVTPSEHDMRHLLVMELRHILVNQKVPVKELAGFRKAEAAARLTLTTKFLEGLAGIASSYEQGLLDKLKKGVEGRVRKIATLFISNITEQVHEWMVAPEFFSPQLQVLLCLILQLDHQELPLERRALEVPLSAYMLDASVERAVTAKTLISCMSANKLLLADDEIGLIMDILELMWDIYYRHSVEILRALQTPTSGSASMALDNWIHGTALPRATMLLPNCRLAHLTRSTPSTFASTSSFSVSVEYQGLSGRLEHDDQRAFYSVISAFGKEDLMALQRYKASPVTPQSSKRFHLLLDRVYPPYTTYKQFRIAIESRRVEVIQLTQTTSKALRRMFSLPGVPAKDIVSLLGRLEYANRPQRSDTQTSIRLRGSSNQHPVKAASKRAFNGLFMGMRPELRTLLNTELSFFLRRLQKNEKISPNPDIQEAFEKWARVMSVEKEAVLEELKRKMEIVSSDPNYMFSSLFFSATLASKIIKSPAYATTGNAAAISAMSAVQQVRLPSWAIKLDPATLKTAQLTAIQHPTLQFTYDTVLRRKLLSPAGKQRVFRRDMVERVAVTMELTARMQHQFFDSMISVLPGFLRQSLENMLCGEHRPDFFAAATELDGKKGLFDYLGFATAFRLAVVAEIHQMRCDHAGRRVWNVFYCDASTRYARAYRNHQTCCALNSTSILALLLSMLCIAFFFRQEYSSIISCAYSVSVAAKSVRNPLTMEVAKQMEKSLPKSEARGVNTLKCIPTNVNFIRCIAKLLFRCRNDDTKCAGAVERVTEANADIWETVYNDIQSPLSEAPQFLNRMPWTKLKYIVSDALAASGKHLSLDEREALSSGFLEHNGESGSSNMRGFHLLRMRSILFKVPESNPGVACIVSVLSEPSPTVSRECFTEMLKMFSSFIADEKICSCFVPAAGYPSFVCCGSEPTGDAELVLLRVAKRVAAQLKTVQLVDNVTPQTIAQELQRLYNMDFSTIYDFVISPMQDYSSSPQEKRTIGACLYQVGRNFERENDMYSEAPGFVLRVNSPALVRNCLTEVWRMRLKFGLHQPVVSASGGALANPNGETTNWEEFTAGLNEMNIVSPADETFRRVASGDSFLFLVIQHRLLAIMDALAAFRETMITRVTKDSEANRSAALLLQLQALSYQEFMRFLMASENAIPFSIGLVAQALTSILCNPVCKEIRSSVNMETRKKQETARVLSQRLNEQVTAMKAVIQSLSVVRASSAVDLSAAFQALESTEMQTEIVSPASLELCSRHLRGLATAALPICSYETVPYRYAHEAFRLTLAQRGIHAHTWFSFFSVNHEVILNNCISEARRLSPKKSVESFMKLAEWRRFLPVVLEKAVKSLRNRFSDIKNLLLLLEGKVEQVGIMRRLRAMADKVAKWVFPKQRKKSRRTQDEPSREEADIEVHDVITLSELEAVPPKAIIQFWREYALSLDSSTGTGMRYGKVARLLTAIGTGFRCAQMFANDQNSFLGGLRGNSAAQENIQRLATEFFLSPGGPQEGFRGIRAAATKSIATFCRGRGSVCKKLEVASTEPVPDSCHRPMVFCTRALACAEPSNLCLCNVSEDCILMLLDDLLTKPNPLISADVVLRSITSVLSAFRFSIVIWNQVTSKVARFREKKDVVTENIPIQIIVAPRGETKMPIYLHEALPGSATESTTSSFAEEDSEEEIFYSAKSTEEPLPAPATTEETELLLVSPGFDLYEHLQEAKRLIQNEHTYRFRFIHVPVVPIASEPSPSLLLRGERTLIDMQDRMSHRSRRRHHHKLLLEDLQRIIDEILSRKDLENTDFLRESRIFSVLGPNEENKKLFSEQKHTLGNANPAHLAPLNLFSSSVVAPACIIIRCGRFVVCWCLFAETLFAETSISPCIVDRHLFELLTAFQLFTACKEIPNDCNEFRVRMLNQVKESLLKAKTEGGSAMAGDVDSQGRETMLKLGSQQQRQLDSMKQIQQAIEKLEHIASQPVPCLTENCSEDTVEILRMFKPVRSLLGSTRYHDLKKESLGRPHSSIGGVVPLESFRMASHLTLSSLPMQQWLDVLNRIRQSLALLSPSPIILRSMSSMEVTCVEVAKRRLKEALGVLQKATQQLSKHTSLCSKLSAVEKSSSQSNKTPLPYLTARKAVCTHCFSAVVRTVLNECCREKDFLERGATYVTHALASRLRGKGYILSASNDMSTLMDNHQDYSTWIQQAVTTEVEKVDDVQWLMISACSEGSFYSQGAAACTQAPNAARALHARLVESQYEVQVWTAIAEILYRTPDTPWKDVQASLRAQERTLCAYSHLGARAVRKLYYAFVFTALHQAVGFVDHDDFKRFGAYALTSKTATP